MTDPVMTAVVKDGWRKVATNVTDVTVIPRKSTATYAWTYRDTGGGAPTLETEQAGLPSGGITLSASAAIDVYVWCKNHSGLVRVDADLSLTYLIDG